MGTATPTRPRGRWRSRRRRGSSARPNRIKPIPAKELFARLKPFQEEVAEDIRRDGEE